jgi:predicted HTH transcriptional regulator
MKNFGLVLQLPEGPRLELKEKVPSREQGVKTVLAFANGQGGELFLGVKNDPREVVGISEDRLFEIEEKLSQAIFDSCNPTIIPDITFHNIDVKFIIRVKVYPGSQPPYYPKRDGKKNGTYIRAGSTNRKADDPIIAELERRRRNISFDSVTLYDVDLAQIDLSSFSLFFKEQTGKELRQKDYVTFGLVREERDTLLPTHAAVLLSEGEVQKKYLPMLKLNVPDSKGGQWKLS